MAKGKSLFHSDWSAKGVTNTSAVDDIFGGTLKSAVKVGKDKDKDGDSVKINENITISKDKHDKLLNAIMNMLYPHVRTRNKLLTRYDRIGKDLAAYMANRGFDEQREKEYAKGKTNSLPDQRYPTAQGHLDDITTHILHILFPSRRMYGATELDPDDQNVAAAFTALLNTHAQQFVHYKEYGKMVHDAVAYNSSGLICEWAVKKGWMNTGKAYGGEQGVGEDIMQGNDVRCADLYNSIWDYSANPSDYSTEAQFYAMVEPINEYQFQKGYFDGKYFGTKNFIKQMRKPSYVEGDTHVEGFAGQYYSQFAVGLDLDANKLHQAGTGLYRPRPSVRSKWYYEDEESNNTGFDAERYFSEDGCIATEEEEKHTNEKLTVWVRLVPKDFGLGDIDYLQIWRLVIINGHMIVSAAAAAEAHGMLPVSRCVLNTEHGLMNSKSIGERLIPFQDASSNILNQYIRSMRKANNNGLIFYDQKRIKLNEMDDPTSGYIPVDVGEAIDGKYQSLGNMVHTVSERPPVNTAINDIAMINHIMQDVMPTDQIEQLANLNRATNHQSQAYTNASSRRIYHLARDVSDEAVSPIMCMMTKNIIEFQVPLTMLDGQGNTIEIDPKAFRDKQVQIAVSDGLRGVDTVAISARISQIIQWCLQSRIAMDQFDVVKLIEYALQTEGAVFDAEKFRYKNEFDRLDQQGKKAAFDLLQQAIAAQQEQE